MTGCTDAAPVALSVVRWNPPSNRCMGRVGNRSAQANGSRHGRRLRTPSLFQDILLSVNGRTCGALRHTMHTVAVVTVISEYDILDGSLPTKTIESYFAKPLAIWDHSTLDPGEAETVGRAFVRSAETRTIEIDREDHVVWVTYAIAVEIDYNPEALDYFGATLDDVIKHGCHVSFPLDERKVEFVDEEISTRVTSKRTSDLS